MIAVKIVGLALLTILSISLLGWNIAFHMNISNREDDEN